MELLPLPPAEDTPESSPENTAGQRARIPRRAQRRADALGIIAESFLKHGSWPAMPASSPSSVQGLICPTPGHLTECRSARGRATAQ